MKKVLLSLSILAAAFTANAQNFKIWDAATSTGFTGAGTAFIFTPGSNGFTVDTTAGVITAAGTAPTAGYYINGFGNGSYAQNGDPQAFGYTAANFATDKFFMNVNAPGMKFKVQFTTYTNGVADADLYGYEFDLSTTTGTTFADVSSLMSNFSKIVANNPNGADFLTAALAAKIGKIEFAINKQANGGTGPGYVKLKNMTIGLSTVITSTASAAANIGSTKVFPNPTEGSFTAEVNLNNATSTTIIVTDMLGKQVASQNLGTVTSSSAVFNTSSLAKGMYTVTYVLDGTPAKTELVVVK
jgi:hypothetical protein